MFADTLSTNMVFPDEAYFSIPVASTVACDYDRTFAVEVIDQGSNAIEGYHYRLKSNTITIPPENVPPMSRSQASMTIFRIPTPWDSNSTCWSPTRSAGPGSMPAATTRKSSSTRAATTTWTPSTAGAWSRRCCSTTTPALDQNYQRLILTEKHPTRTQRSSFTTSSTAAVTSPCG